MSRQISKRSRNYDEMGPISESAVDGEVSHSRHHHKRSKHTSSVTNTTTKDKKHHKKTNSTKKSKKKKKKYESSSSAAEEDSESDGSSDESDDSSSSSSSSSDSSSESSSSSDGKRKRHKKHKKQSKHGKQKNRSVEEIVEPQRAAVMEVPDSPDDVKQRGIDTKWEHSAYQEQRQDRRNDDRGGRDNRRSRSPSGNARRYQNNDRRPHHEDNRGGGRGGIDVRRDFRRDDNNRGGYRGNNNRDNRDNRGGGGYDNDRDRGVSDNSRYQRNDDNNWRNNNRGGGGDRGGRGGGRNDDFRRQRNDDNSRGDGRRHNNEYRGGNDDRNDQQTDRKPIKTEDERRLDWGLPTEPKGEKPEVEKEKPNFALSGKLTEDTNKVNGVVIKYAEPAEARRPKRRWRLYPFKGDQSLPTMYIHRQSCYLIGRDRKICDLPIDHPSCSKQHAVLQYRLVPFTRDDGTKGKRVRPYVLDLESSNGTFINNKPIDPKKYIELLEKDVLKFGFSSREYVILHENSKDEEEDDDVLVE